MMIDLARLTYASVVADEGSYARASLRIGISQPALSRGIQTLERQYGIQIFTRGHDGAKLTAQGAELVAIAQRLINQATATDQQLSMITSGSRAPVALGLGPISAATTVPILLPELAKEGVKLRIRVEPLNTLKLLLRQGEIDFFVSGLNTKDGLLCLPDDFRVKRIPFSSINLFVRKGHQLLKGSFDQAALLRYPVGSTSFLRELLPSTLLARYGLASVTIEFDDYAVLGELARNSDFIIVGVRGLSNARPDLGLDALPIDVPVQDIEYGLVSASSKDLSPDARRIATLIHDNLTRQMVRAERTPR